MPSRIPPMETADSDPGPKPPQRVFFALRPEASTAARLHGAACREALRRGGRVMTEDSLHLTLAFLGEIDEAAVDAARRAADGLSLPAFVWTVDRLDYWPHNRILWAGASAPATPLLALGEALRIALAAAGLAVDPRPFAPHVTLLRNCPGADGQILADPIPWTAREFHLLQTASGESGRYRSLARWPLRGGGRGG